MLLADDILHGFANNVMCQLNFMFILVTKSIKITNNGEKYI